MTDENLHPREQAPRRRRVDVAFAGNIEADPFPRRMAPRGRLMLQALLLVAIALIAYLPALRGTFLPLDDQTLTANPAMRSVRGLGAMWLHPTISANYQPLGYTLLWLEYRLFAARAPGGYHAVSVVLHAVVVLLLWTVLRKLGAPGALVAAAAFAVHPLPVDAVAWISRQPILLCGVFSLLSMLVILRAEGIDPPPEHGGWMRLPEQRWICGLLALALFGAALASHAAATALPLVALLIVWWRRSRPDRQGLILLFAMLLMSGAWILIVLLAHAKRSAALGEVSRAGASEQLPAVASALGSYLWHIVCPIGLVFAYPESQEGSFLVRWLPAVAIVAVMLLVWTVRRRVGRAAMLGGLLLVVLLAPALLLPADFDALTPLSDHAAYLAAAAVVATTAALAAHALRRRPGIGGAVSVLTVALLLVLAMLRTRDYRSPESAWASALRRDPGSVVAHNELGLIALRSRRDIPAAMMHFRAALQADPRHVTTQLHIAAAYEASGEIDKAIMQYRQLLHAAAGHVDARLGLARSLSRRGNSAEALALYESVLALHPNHVEALNNLGLLHAERAEFAPAERAYRRAIETKPDFFAAHLNLANLYFLQRRVPQAVQTLHRVLELDPDNLDAFINASAMTGQLAREADSPQQRQAFQRQCLQFARKAQALAPDSPVVCNNLGLALLAEGYASEARFYLQKAVELEPTNDEFRRNLAHASAQSPGPSRDDPFP